MFKQSIQYGDVKIHYKVIFCPLKKSPQRKQKIAIHVHHDGQVTVDAPQNTALTEVKIAVQKRAGWINKHLTRINKIQATILPREYVGGESHWYLGKQYVLKISKRNCPPAVKLRQGQLQILTANSERGFIKALLWRWYITHAQRVFAARLEIIGQGLKWLKEPPGFKLVEMKRQWGSCSPKGNISLNPHLIKAPRYCVDYVILHELCHLKHPKGL